MARKKTKSVRLSANIIPEEYEIRLHPDLENFTFSGIEVIALNVLKKTDTITLHSKEIDIETADIALSKDEKIFARKISYDKKAETATFRFPKKISAGKWKLNIVFQGILNDKMRGFYRSKYHVNGKEHHMATTQFEATDARSAFPCFDEPAKKAVFKVSLVVPKGHTAISNTLPVSVKEHEAGYEIVHFSPTPKMSTYLLAFIVGKFEFLESKTKSGVQVRVFTTPGKKHQAKFALDCTVKVLEFYEKYFAIPYPLPTMDMIAIPDFTSLAMENWGAITFREIGILVDEKNTSLGTKELVAEVIAHELAHQWFGNLVTMEWWTHLWLNEGFASYIPYLAISKIFPKWNVWERFATDTLNIALRLDSLLSTHPIEVEVHHPNEIGEIFDAVSYSKGASVIAMIADYLGEKDFREGLRYYLKKHSYKNTATVHLWRAFEKVSGKPVEKIMQNWTGKGGYPVIRAEEKGKMMVLSQERFFSSPVSKKKAGKNAEGRTVWQVPVSFGNTGARKKIFLSRRKDSISLPESWVKINLGESGFFRTAYSPALLNKLRGPVEKKLLPSYDRLGIVRDLFALAEAGVIPTTEALDFLSAYKHEDSYVVWVEISRGLSQLEQLMAKTASAEKLDSLIISLYSPLLRRLGWKAKPKESNTDTLLRSLAIIRLGKSHDSRTVETAGKLWKLSLGGKPVHPDIRSAVYGTIAANGGKKEFEAFIKMYKTETLHEEQNRIGGALSDFSDPAILAKVCQFSISKHVRTQDSVSILSGVGANPFGRDIWWNFVRKNWKLLSSRYGEGIHALGRMLKAISMSPESRHLASFKNFFKTHGTAGAERSVEQVIEKLESNAAWLSRDKKEISSFLKNWEKYAARR